MLDCTHHRIDIPELNLPPTIVEVCRDTQMRNQIIIDGRTYNWKNECGENILLCGTDNGKKWEIPQPSLSNIEPYLSGRSAQWVLTGTKLPSLEADIPSSWPERLQRAEELLRSWGYSAWLITLGGTKAEPGIYAMSPDGRQYIASAQGVQQASIGSGISSLQEHSPAYIHHVTRLDGRIIGYLMNERVRSILFGGYRPEEAIWSAVGISWQRSGISGGDAAYQGSGWGITYHQEKTRFGDQSLRWGNIRLTAWGADAQIGLRVGQLISERGGATSRSRAAEITGAANLIDITRGDIRSLFSSDVEIRGQRGSEGIISASGRYSWHLLTEMRLDESTRIGARYGHDYYWSPLLYPGKIPMSERELSRFLRGEHLGLTLETRLIGLNYSRLSRPLWREHRGEMNWNHGPHRIILSRREGSGHGPLTGTSTTETNIGYHLRLGPDLSGDITLSNLFDLGISTTQARIWLRYTTR